MSPIVPAGISVMGFPEASNQPVKRCPTFDASANVTVSSTVNVAGLDSAFVAPSRPLYMMLYLIALWD